MKTGAFLFLILLLSTSVLAVELKGTIYDENLEIANDVLITINSSPEQRMLAIDGKYSFSLSQGNYMLKAEYLSQGNERVVEETITLSQEGTFVFDLFLIPALDEDIFFNEFEKLPEQPETTELVVKQNTDFQSIVTRLVIVASILLFIYLIWRYTRKSVEEFDDISVKILRTLKENNNRMTQKELRQKFSESEATISLALSDLQNQGKIEKIKKGRANIIKIK